MVSKTPTEKKSDTKITRSGAVQSVERALRLLEVLGADEEGYRLTDLAVQTGLSPSTVHRLLATLESRRFVQFDQSDGMWHVGRQAFAVGSAFVRQRNFVAPSLPFLRQLRDQTRETANIGVVDDGEVVTLAQVESREIMRAISPVGGRAPIIASGMGKAILATYPEADVDATISRRGLRRVTPNTFTRADDLKADLRKIQLQGYALDDEEFVLGLRCVAASVYNQQGEALCAISISGLTSRVTPSRIPELGKLVFQTANALTSALGGTCPCN
jgi:IclR family transcriptional regulator, acetate operon repressor